MNPISINPIDPLIFKLVNIHVLHPLQMTLYFVIQSINSPCSICNSAKKSKKKATKKKRRIPHSEMRIMTAV